MDDNTKPHSLQISERLEECARFLNGEGVFDVAEDQLAIWAADIRSLVIPQPLDDVESDPAPDSARDDCSPSS